jgi:hypothetical protein
MEEVCTGRTAQRAVEDRMVLAREFDDPLTRFALWKGSNTFSAPHPLLNYAQRLPEARW